MYKYLNYNRRTNVIITCDENQPDFLDLMVYFCDVFLLPNCNLIEIKSSMSNEKDFINITNEQT